MLDPQWPTTAAYKFLEVPNLHFTPGPKAVPWNAKLHPALLSGQAILLAAVASASFGNRGQGARGEWELLGSGSWDAFSPNGNGTANCTHIRNKVMSCFGHNFTAIKADCLRSSPSWPGLQSSTFCQVLVVRFRTLMPRFFEPCCMRFTPRTKPSKQILI